jgi:hypothetical protein
VKVGREIRAHKGSLLNKLGAKKKKPTKAKEGGGGAGMIINFLSAHRNF